MSAPVLTNYKLDFFKKRFLSTLLGGYRLSFDNDKIPCVLQLFQFMVYVIPTIVTIILGVVLDSGWLYGIIPAIINTVLLIFILPLINRKSHSEIFSYVFRKRGFGEAILGLTLTAGLSFLLGWHVNCLSKLDNAAKLVAIILTAIASANYYCSLFIDSPYEITAVINKSPDFSIYSNTYSRPIYGIIVLLIKILKENKDAIDYSEISHGSAVGIVVFIAIPYAMTFGMLGNIYLTATWAIEYINIHFFGDTVRSTDTRTNIAIVFNIVACFIGSIGFLIEGKNGLTYSHFLLAFLAFASANNYMQNFGVARIFRDRTRKKFKINGLFCFFLIFFLGGTIAIIVLKDVAEVERMRVGAVVLFLIALAFLVGLQFIRYLSESVVLTVIVGKSRKLRRFLPGVAWEGLRCFCFFSVLCEETTADSDYGRYLSDCFLLYGFLKLSLINPVQVVIIWIEFIIILSQMNQPRREPVYSDLVWPVLFIINRAVYSSGRKIIIWLFSVTKLTHKSSKLKRACPFIILSFTLFLPVNLISIFLSSLIGTPIIPVFGVPLFITGFPRPRRIWNEAATSFKNNNEAFMYKQLMISFRSIFADLANRIPMRMNPDSYFLLRINKYIAMVYVMERGENYMVINFKGLELQDTTSCHNVESQTFDSLIEKYFEKKDSCLFSELLGSIEPVQTYEIEGYEENNLKLTGIKDAPDFLAGFKMLYLKLIIYFIKKELVQKGRETILEGFSKSLDSIYNFSKINAIYPDGWANFIGVEEVKGTKNDADASKSQKVSGSIIENLPPGKKKTLPAIEKKKKKKPKPLAKDERHKDEIFYLLDEMEGTMESNSKNKLSKDLTKIKGDPLLRKESDDEDEDEENKHTSSDDFPKESSVGSREKENAGGSMRASILGEDSRIRKVALYLLSYTLNDRDFELKRNIDDKALISLFENAGILEKARYFKDTGERSLLSVLQIICAQAIRYAMKIALDIYTIEYTFDTYTNDNLKEYVEECERDWFIGTASQPEMLEAIDTCKKYFMTMNLIENKGLSIYRGSFSKMKGHLFEMNDEVVKGIWSNLIFELLYATNDDNERYSIQSDPSYLRNLIIESAEEPLGYALFYSGPLLVRY